MIKKMFIASFTFLSACTVLLGNNKVDSLENILQTKELSVREQLDVQFALIKALKVRGAKADSLIDVSEQLAETNNLIYEQAQAKYYRGMFYSYKGQNDGETLKCFEFADSIAKTDDTYKELAVKTSKRIALHYLYQRDYPAGIEKMKSTLALAKTHELSAHYSSISVNIGLLYGLDNQFFKAIEQFQTALEYPNTNRSSVFWNLADLSSRLEDHEQVIHYADLAIDAARKENKEIAECMSAFLKSEALQEMEKYVEAEEILLAYIPRIKATSRPFVVYGPYAQLISLYRSTGQLQKARAIENELPPEPRPTNYAPMGTALGQVYNDLENPSKAIKYCEGSKLLAQKNMPGSAPWMAAACYCLNKAYTAIGDFREAHQNLSEYQEAKVILDERAQIMNLSRALNQQELEQQELLLTMEQEKKAAVYEATLSKYQQGGTLGLGLLLVALGVIYQFRKQNKKISTQNKMISQALKEKDILLKEIHHRVKNNLQLVSSLLGLQSYRIKDPNALEVLNSSKSRVKSMALIHQDLYNQESLTGVEVKAYLGKLCTELLHTFKIKEDRIALNFVLPDMVLDVDTLVPLGLIINELITNSLKYAFPDNRTGAINIQLFESNNMLHLKFSDNGIGMDQRKAKSSSFGLKLIHTLLDQLDGEMQLEVKEGTHFSFSFGDYQIAA